MPQDNLWSDEELRIAVNSYLYMLNLELGKIPFSSAEMSGFLIRGPLSNRNEASVRYRMRNISYVIESRAGTILKDFSPAPGVGTGVKKRIEKILDESSEFDAFLGIKTSSEKETLQEVVLKLDALHEALSSLKSVHPHIGHNNPPEAIEGFFNLDEVEEVKIHIVSIKNALKKDKIDTSEIVKKQNFILQLGHKLAILTAKIVFGISAAVVLGAAGQIGANLVPQIMDAAYTLSKYLNL